MKLTANQKWKSGWGLVCTLSGQDVVKNVFIMNLYPVKYTFLRSLYRTTTIMPIVINTTTTVTARNA